MKRTGKFVNAIEWKMLEATHALENWEPGQADVPSLRTRGRIGDDEGEGVKALIAKLAEHYGVEGKNIIILPGGEFLVDDEAQTPGIPTMPADPKQSQQIAEEKSPVKKVKSKRGKK